MYAVKLSHYNKRHLRARYVAKGFSQVQNFDYQETFSPTVKLTSIRMLVQISVRENYVVRQMDFWTEYLSTDT